MSRAIMKQALDALDVINSEFLCRASHHSKKDRHYLLDECPIVDRHEAAIQALKSELAKPEPEPVAWREFDGEGGYMYYDFDGNENRLAEWDERYKDSPQYKGWIEPLFIREKHRE